MFKNFLLKKILLLFIFQRIHVIDFRKILTLSCRVKTSILAFSISYFYTKHFLERMVQRNIPQNALIFLLKSGMKRYDENSGIYVFEGRHNEEDYRIIARKQKEHFVLVTIYRIS